MGPPRSRISRSWRPPDRRALVEQLAQRPHRPAAMAQSILAVAVELRRRRPERGNPKVRVVAESARPAGRIDDYALPDALGHQGVGIMRPLDEHQSATVACPAP